MDPIQTKKTRTDLSLEPTAVRQTPRSGVPFREVLGRSASTLVQGAEAALYKLPGGPVLAAAVRPGGTLPGTLAPTVAPGSARVAGGGGSAEGPSPTGGGGSPGSAVEDSLAASQDMNLYYLQLQEAMQAENRVYTAQSNVLKARHDTVKNAIGNIR